MILDKLIQGDEQILALDSPEELATSPFPLLSLRSPRCQADPRQGLGELGEQGRGVCVAGRV